MGTFLLAIAAALGSQVLLANLGPIVLKFVILLIIIFTGIVFDIIGVAAAVASESTFHAKSARRMFGAEQAVRMARKADQVASFSNDVVGDISGTLSGAMGTAIIFEIVTGPLDSHILIAGTVMTAFIAGLTVGGKAIGKNIAIQHADEIIFRVGKILAVVENTLGIRIVGDSVKKGRK
ncbi:MAG: hypothetical protein GX318_04615 [Clostridia bacterium]|nr:hypothetical protein [Clostridia bacterium]